MFDGGADDEGGGGRVVGNVLRSDTRADQSGNGDGAAYGFYFVGVGGLAGGDARDDYAIGAEEFGGFGGFDDVHIGGDGVGGVFFLDVGEDANVFGANRAAIAQERAGGGLDETFIGYVGEDKTFNADKTGAAGVRDGEGPQIGAGEDLDSERERACATNFRGDGGHCCADLGSYGSFQIGAVVGVFDGESVKAGRRVEASFTNGVFGDCRDGFAAGRSAGKGANVDDADESAWRIED